MIRTSSVNLSSTNIRAFGRITLVLRDDEFGRGTVGLTSTEGFLNCSWEERARLIGRWRMDCSASEPESEEEEVDSAGSSSALVPAGGVGAGFDVFRLRGA
jgi:hypothetical protein